MSKRKWLLKVAEKERLKKLLAKKNRCGWQKLVDGSVKRKAG